MTPVALRKESVDRNVSAFDVLAISAVSLSARRAWIEIQSGWPGYQCKRSLSARRAWIEISLNYKEVLTWVVALRKESVDRNILLIPSITLLISRSPQGERG